MKLQLMSDLHLEFPAAEIEPINSGSDVLVLSGDICSVDSVMEVKPFFQMCSERWRDVIYVMGNHEHYHGNFPDTLHILRSSLNDIENLHILEKDYVEIDGVYFWGASLWTDCNQADAETIQALNRGMNDYRLVQNGQAKFSAERGYFEHNSTLDSLKEFLKGVSKIDEYKVVICTHHAPSKKSLHPRYKYDQLINGGYSSDLEDLIKANPNIQVWTHGHTHDSFDYMVGKTRVVANPAGFQMRKGQLENQKFDMLKLIEVRN